MATQTPNFGFSLSAVNSPTDEDIWGDELNDNFTSLDSLLKAATNDVTNALTASTTLTATSQNELVLCNAASASFTVTLLAAAIAGNGFKVAFKKTDSSANTITVQANAAELIDRSNTYIISTQDNAIVMISDGTQWWLTVVPAAAIANATSSTFGIVKPDNTTITISGGVISAAPQGVTLGTPVATTSGTAIPLTGIPATAKVVRVNFVGVAMSSGEILLQLGTSGGVVSSGYIAGETSFAAGSGTSIFVTTGFIFGNNATYTTHGTLTLTLENASTNTWCLSGVTTATGTNSVVTMSSGRVSLSGTLSQLNLTSVSGSATFSAGEMNINYQ